MANRSKKVVLSARVDPYLKAALELFATTRNQKIVKLLETFIEKGLSNIYVDDPLANEKKDARYMDLFTAIWSEDEVVFKLRAGGFGMRFAGEKLWMIANVVLFDPYFAGGYKLYGDMNGMTARVGYKPPKDFSINLELVKGEWDLIVGYVDFLETNKPFTPSYDDYKRMRKQSEAK